MRSSFNLHLAKTTLLVVSLGFATLALYLWNRSSPKWGTATDPIATDCVILDPLAIGELGITMAEVGMGDEGDALQVPATALLCREGRQFVFVRDFDMPHTFVRVPVDAGRGGGSSAAITGGLFPGDEVVVSGVDLLATEKATSLSNEALRRILDAPFHRTEHQTCPQKFWQRLRGILPRPLQNRS